jgi:hypothetical protein
MQFCGNNYWFYQFLFIFGLNYFHDVVSKKSKQRIFLSWMLLTFFAAGQFIVYSHHHHNSGPAVTKAAQRSSHQTVSEKCQLCDAMNANHMMLNSNVYSSAPLLSYHLFTAGRYSFVSISLILSSDRGPPVS